MLLMSSTATIEMLYLHVPWDCIYILKELIKLNSNSNQTPPLQNALTLGKGISNVLFLFFSAYRSLQN